MQAEAGKRLCFHWNPWELKQGEAPPASHPYLHPQPVLPARPAGLLVELVVPLRVVQCVAPQHHTDQTLQ